MISSSRIEIAIKPMISDKEEQHDDHHHYRL